MRVYNHTGFRTLDLKRIFHEVIKHDGENGRWKKLEVSVRYKKRNSFNGVTGLAGIDSHWIEMYFPKGEIDWDYPLARNVAWVFAHELKHCRGRTEKDIIDPKYPHVEFAWADELPLRKKDEI